MCLEASRKRMMFAAGKPRPTMFSIIRRRTQGSFGSSEDPGCSAAHSTALTTETIMAKDHLAAILLAILQHSWDGSPTGSLRLLPVVPRDSHTCPLQGTPLNIIPPGSTRRVYWSSTKNPGLMLHVVSSNSLIKYEKHSSIYV